MNAELPPGVRLLAAVIARTGHHYYADKPALLIGRASERLHATGAANLDAYLDLLADPEAGEAEWRAFEPLLTIGETYFFRHADHFTALREDIIPRLLKERAQSKTLRIWSIGCANGAEPYSLAILLHEMLGEALNEWTITLVGGDINEAALSAARAGVYSNWALRALTPAERARYFDQPDARHWRLKPHFRRMARFERQNLLDLLAPAPPLAWSEFDLILCRNVLIYFSAEQAMRLIGELRARLREGGALVLGHAEAALTAQPDLPAYDEPLPSAFALSLDPISPLHLPAHQDHTPAIIPAAAAVAPPPMIPAPPLAASNDPAVTLADLRLAADAGEYERARRISRQLLAADPQSATLHYYDALLAQVCEDEKAAEAALRRALYLDRSNVLAHHRLGLVLIGRGQNAKGRQSLLTAARLAAALPPNLELPDAEGATAGEFAAAVRAQIQALGHAA